MAKKQRFNPKKIKQLVCPLCHAPHNHKTIVTDGEFNFWHCLTCNEDYIRPIDLIERKAMLNA